MAVHRALFGYHTTKTVKGKRYQSERPGVVQFPGQRMGPGVLFVPAHQDAAVRAGFDGVELLEDRETTVAGHTAVRRTYRG